MKKFLITLIIVSVIVIPFTTYAQGDTGIDINAKAAVLIDAESGKVMFEKNADSPLPIASVTKVMTLLLAFEAVENKNIGMDDEITVSETASSMGGSQAFIDAGYKYKVSELIKSIIIASANDSAVAIAEQIAGNENAFVAKMNKKAQELGMTNTVFKNCTGLPENGHYSSAKDVAVMSMQLLKYEDYFKWGTVWIDEIKHEKDGRTTELVNTNRLIRSLDGCDGLKTGYTNEAGFCVTATSKRGEMRLISVILGGSTSKERFSEAASLINYGFANYVTVEVIKAEDLIGEIKLNGGKEKIIKLKASEGYSACVKNDELNTIETSVEIPEYVEAPVSKNQKLGKVIILENGQKIGEISLVADKDYEKAGFFERLKGILLNWN